MTRDEIIDLLSKHYDAQQLAQAICHEAFDMFAQHYGDRIGEVLQVAWEAFRDGWDSYR